jgi:hypothetical protein
MVIGQVNITELNDVVVGLEDKLKREIDDLAFDEQEYRSPKPQNPIIYNEMIIIKINEFRSVYIF